MKIIKFFQKGIKNAVVKNAASLYLVLFANYILPFITVPYVVRVLGPEGFGTIAFCLGIINYFKLVVNYGFEWSATRSISVQRDDLEAISRIASNVWAAKALLFIVGLSFLVVIAVSVPTLREISMYLFILSGIVFGDVCFPNWLYQGLERMEIVSIINLVFRGLITLGIFIFVRQGSDLPVYASLLSFQWLGAGTVGAWIAYRIFEVRLLVPQWKDVRKELAKGFSLFLSSGFSGVYTVGNVFILGLLTNNTIVGYYGAAERLVRAVVGLVGPISKAAYPRSSKIASESTEDALSWVNRFSLLVFGMGAFLSIILFSAAIPLCRVMFGASYGPSANVLRILAPLPLLIGASNVFGVQIMLPFGRDKEFMKVIFGAAVMNVLLACIFAPIWQANGMAIAVLLTELFVTVTFLGFLISNKLTPIKRPRTFPK